MDVEGLLGRRPQNGWSEDDVDPVFVVVPETRRDHETGEEVQLYPENVPDHVIVRRLRDVDRGWRVEWDRLTGRWNLWHTPANTRLKPAYITLETPLGRYRPLDMRAVHEVRFAAWLARIADRSPGRFDTLVHKMRKERVARKLAEARAERRYLLRHAIGEQKLEEMVRDGSFAKAVSDVPPEARGAVFSIPAVTAALKTMRRFSCPIKESTRPFPFSLNVKDSSSTSATTP